MLIIGDRIDTTRKYIAGAINSAIIDPTDAEMYAALKASELITGRDHFCLGYIRAFKEGRLGSC
jgi:hypothetical protein